MYANNACLNHLAKHTTQFHKFLQVHMSTEHCTSSPDVGPASLRKPEDTNVRDTRREPPEGPIIDQLDKRGIPPGELAAAQFGTLTEEQPKCSTKLDCRQVAASSDFVLAGTCSADNCCRCWSALLSTRAHQQWIYVLNKRNGPLVSPFTQDDIGSKWISQLFSIHVLKCITRLK